MEFEGKKSDKNGGFGGNNTEKNPGKILKGKWWNFWEKKKEKIWKKIQKKTPKVWCVLRSLQKNKKKMGKIQKW